MAAFTGAWPALVTPLTSEDTVNAALLRDLAEFYVGKGVAAM